MTETVIISPVPTVASSPMAKKTQSKNKKAVVKKPAAAHPSTSVMVTSAITELKEKKGSSLPAIKKYLAANYNVDPVKLAPFIRKFLKAAVANGTFVQTTGTGASGHFKIAVAEVKPKKTASVKKPVSKKVKVVLPKKKIVAKKAKSTPVEPAAKKLKKTPVEPAAKELEKKTTVAPPTAATPVVKEKKSKKQPAAVAKPRGLILFKRLR